jgi:hypothetical protein
MSSNNFNNTRFCKTTRSSSSRDYPFTSREIKKDDKLNKNMDKYTKEVHDFKIKVKVPRTEDGLNLIENNLKYLLQTNNKLQKIHTVNNLLFLFYFQIDSINLDSKKKEINNLNDNIDNCLLANEELKSFINNLTNKRNLLESDQKSISDYCNQLKKKFKDIERTVLYIYYKY